jgi:coenzyme F420-dependent glucose-6-phosphate dehydrogenase
VIRQLWQGGSQTYRGRFYTVEQARIYTLPEEQTPIMVAAGGQAAVELASHIGDGLIGTTPYAQLIQQFDAARGTGRPRYGQITVCWAKDETTAQRTAFEWWPNAAIKGQLSQELPTPTFFEQAAQMVREEDVAQAIICGPDPQRHIQAIQQFVDAGYDHVYVHQVGPDQEGFFQFYQAEVLPKFV